MLRVAVVSLSFMLSVVEVHTQTIFYISFKGQALANHSYVNLSHVGHSESYSVQCLTDLGRCCTEAQGFHRGNWNFPIGHSLPFSGEIYQTRGNKRVDLYRNNGTSPTGMYYCHIPTTAVHDFDDRRIKDKIYIGLYATGGIVYSMSFR